MQRAGHTTMAALTILYLRDAVIPACARLRPQTQANGTEPTHKSRHPTRVAVASTETPDLLTSARKSLPLSGARNTPDRSLGRVLSAWQLWDLMGRWRVSDAAALELIDYPGKIGSSGKRPRLRFTTRQKRATSYLAEIDRALAAVGRNHHWLHRKIQGEAFSDRAPIQHVIARGLVGAGDVLQVLNREAMRAALMRSESRGPRNRHLDEAPHRC
jgi:hypothetical protein